MSGYDPRNHIRNWPAVESQWRQGPFRDKVIDAHTRSILCMATHRNRLVTGSADHGLKEFDLSVDSGKEVRQLFSKNFGHSEWVTCVAYAADGRILSGAMDSKLCLWEAALSDAAGGLKPSSAAARCSFLEGHTSSISALKIDSRDIAVSSSYDATLKVWDLAKGQKAAASSSRLLSTLSGHAKAVLNFAWHHSLVVSAGRDASIYLWDLNMGRRVAELKGHKQPVQTIELFSSFSQEADDGGSASPTGSGAAMNNLVVSGSWDGQVRVFDLRSNRCIAIIDAHPNAHVNCIKPVGTAQAGFDFSRYGFVSNVDSPMAPSDVFVTGGSDGLLNVIDVRAGFQIRHCLQGHRDAVGCAVIRGSLCLSGAANGWVLVHDVESGECLYGVGASKEAVRCIEALPERACIGGDDGTVMVLDFFKES